MIDHRSFRQLHRALMLAQNYALNKINVLKSKLCLTTSIYGICNMYTHLEPDVLGLFKHH